MNNKDPSLSGTVTANVQEMNVVLSECHDGVIAIGVRSFLDGIPRERC